MEFLTEEEEFELQYADDLDILNEMDSVHNVENLESYTNDDKTADETSKPSQSENNLSFSALLTQKKDSIKTKGEINNDWHGIKRPITEVDENYCEIEHFDIAKKKLKTSEHSTKTNYDNHVSTEGKSVRCISLSRVSNSESLPITKFDGSRTYLNLCENSDGIAEIFCFSQNVSNLLSTPIDVLKMQVFQETEQNLLRNVSTENFETSCAITTIDPEQSVPDADLKINAQDSELWVEKYSPRSFVDLLSDEGVNRMLLRWLKLWDKSVFGREKKSRAKANISEPKSQTSKFQKHVVELMEELDDHGRPYHKVAFLCGPPGLGKTTLANIVARHAGYNVIELNASDDRSPEVFRTSLEAATQMRSVLDKDHRPNCLIIDEIDGAPLPSINILVSFVKSTGAPKGKQTKGHMPLLMRPVICVCNDQYTSSLKPLRQLALVLNFPVTAKNRLSARMYEVAKAEGLQTDLTTLMFLCEKADNDIRSCLSTLQFVHNQKKELHLSDITGMHIGQKDLHKSLFSVWQDIFHTSKKNNKKSRIEMDLENCHGLEVKDSSLRTRFSTILKIVQSFGEYEKLLNGMFENYLNIKFKDTHLEALWKGPEWMCFADMIQHEIMQSQIYNLLPYVPYVGVAYHLLFASNTYPHLSYPSSYFECMSKKTQFLGILASILSEVVVSLKSFFNVHSLVLDILPILLDIIKPNLRPVNTHLYSEWEKAELKHVIDVMIAFNINYRQERSLEGHYNYILEPNIEDIAQFSGLKQKRTLLYATKQLIAREVDLEKMRRSENSDNFKKANTETSQNVVKPNTIDPKNVATVEKPNLDFFGRKVEEPIGDLIKDDAIKTIDPIWFHFKEGYSNAVRKTVYIKDLL